MPLATIVPTFAGGGGVRVCGFGFRGWGFKVFKGS